MALSTLYLNSQAQHWIDRDLYPFDSHYVQLKAGKMHYIDEGEGEILLFVHGTPTWSFLYRDIIKELSKTHRCIAIDHLGFGLSEKITAFSGTPQVHAQNLEEFIQKLDLQHINLVVHDFGGSIGLGAALQMPQRFKRITLFNSWLWSTKEDPAAQQIDGLLNSLAGEEYYLNQNYSAVVLLKQAFSDPEKLSETVHQHYIAPFPTPDSRQALLKLGKQFVGASDWYETQWQQLHQLDELPWLILWGTKDPFLDRGYLNKWKARLPHATVKSLEVGHFVQEEATEEVIKYLKAFLY